MILIMKEIGLFAPENSVGKKLPPQLWLISVPLGNLGDVTPRQKQALQEAPCILAEDTRNTLHLLARLGITGAGASKKIQRFDAHREFASSLERLFDEYPLIALVTDAGTPAIADPGARLVAFAHQKQIPVLPIPGLSAVSILMSVSGFEANAGWLFLGFFPRQSAEVAMHLQWLQKGVHVLWFESALRIVSTLEKIAQLYPERLICVAKELTKIHETIYQGPACEILKQVATTGVRKGEWCLSVQASLLPLAEKEGEPTPWQKAATCLLKAKVGSKEIAQLIHSEYDVSVNIVYKFCLCAKTLNG
jgi:16S rRNA (cytidine1402-2'-O)-methyltransferase